MKRWNVLATQLLAAVSVSLLGTQAGATDIWDSATDNDDTPGVTDNVLWHTAPPQVHDLQNKAGVADQDWYVISPRAARSYEVQVLNVTGTADIWANQNNLRRTNAAGTATIQSSQQLDPANWLRTLRWVQTASEEQRIVVTNGSTAANFTSQYTILFRETTLYCPRYNQSGTQTSVLILQRTDADTTASCSYTVHFYNETSAEVGTTGGSLSVNDVDVIAIGTLTGLPGQKGAAHIAHTCGIGGFKAKMVALEPATGFSFDTPCSEKDR